MSVVAIGVVLVLLLAAGFHFYWGLGGTFGFSVAIPQRPDGTPLFKPSALACHGVGLALVAAIVCVLAVVGIIALPMPPVVLKAGVSALALIFAARALSWSSYVGLFKKIRHTPFGRLDTCIFSPLCLLVSLGLAAILVSPA